MRSIVLTGLVTSLFVISFSGCAAPFVPPPVTSVVPSISGTPNSVASLGDYEFVSIQGTGQIFTYNISGGSQRLISMYATPCHDPSGMVIAHIASRNVMAVVCFDTGSLLTLTVNSSGSLSPLGAISGLPSPYPGIALEGTNVFVPLFSQGASTNGAVARISIASPANPVITATATLASPASGEFVNPGYLAVANGDIFVTAGSESSPPDTSSTIQVVNEATMTLVGTPLVVAHSPQQVAVQGSVAYVTVFDATQLESIDISDPANLRPLQIATLSQANAGCHPLPILVSGNSAYIGCYTENQIAQFDITDPTRMQVTQNISGVAYPQRLAFTGKYLLVPGSVSGGPVYQINIAKAGH